MIALLTVMEVVIAVATIYFDFTFVGVALLIGMAIIAVGLPRVPDSARRQVLLDQPGMEAAGIEPA